MHRRNFVTTCAAAITGSGLAAAPATKEAAKADFTFLHLTDMHIQPEKHAVEGCRRCFSEAKKAKPAFALAGGDLVFDAAEQTLERARLVYGLYTETVKQLDMPVHAAIGNHDLFGTSANSGVDKSVGGWGKKMFEDHIGPRYHSFDHEGWHFVILDSIGIRPNGNFYGHVDEEQLIWLKKDVGEAGKKPSVVLTHVPLVSGALAYLKTPLEQGAGMLVGNSGEVLDVLASGNVKMVLQGHTHINERVEFKGCHYITTGAVSGNWWRGARLGFPEGYGVIRVKGETASWQFRPYPFAADAA